ncbi:putative myo-inositol transporter [Wallemia mellicola]|nr:putative myo-inositol transporter [Wallemia mellicola]
MLSVKLCILIETLVGTLVTINSVTITFGQLVSYGIGAVLYKAPKGWRIMLVLGAAPAIYQAIAIHMLPESPRYLLARNRSEEAYNALARMYPRATQEEMALKFDILTANVDESVRMSNEHTTWELIKMLFTLPRNQRSIFLTMCLQATQQLCGFNGLMYFAPTLFGMLGFENPATGGMVVAGANFVFTATGMLVVDKVGRRPLLAYVSCPGTILGCVWSIVSLYYLTKDTGFQLVDGAAYDPGKQIAVVIGFCSLIPANNDIAMFAIGLGHVPWTSTDLFSLEVRGIGTGIGTATVWIYKSFAPANAHKATNLIISESYLSMQKGMTPSGTFGLFAGFVLCGWSYIVTCYPETAGLQLEEVQEVLKDGYNVRKSVKLRKANRKALKASKMHN